MSCATQRRERTEIEREELAVVGDYRFVTEQTVIYEDGVEYDSIYKLPLRMETVLIVYKNGVEIHREEEWRWEIDRHHPKPGTDVTAMDRRMSFSRNIPAVRTAALPITS